MDMPTPSSQPTSPDDEFHIDEDEELDLGDTPSEEIPSAEDSAPHPMAVMDTPPQRDRIVVLGRTRAGKTIYLARLYEQCWNQEGPLRIEAHDGRTHLALLNVVEEMQEHHRWPPATDANSYLDLQITWKGRNLTMVSLDYPGEVFRRAFVQQVEDEDTRELIDHVRRASAMLLLIDPKVWATGRLGEAADDDFGMVQAMRYLRSLPGGMDVPIALVLTKIDENAALLRQHGKLRGFALKFCGNLIRTVPRIRIFGVCAVRVRRGSNGQPLPELGRPPRGLTGPVEFCMQRVFAQRHAENRNRAMTAFKDRVQREEVRAVIEERTNDRFWLTVNTLLVVGVVLVGIVTWFIVKSSN